MSQKAKVIILIVIIILVTVGFGLYFIKKNKTVILESQVQPASSVVLDSNIIQIESPEKEDIMIQYKAIQEKIDAKIISAEEGKKQMDALGVQFYPIPISVEDVKDNN